MAWTDPLVQVFNPNAERSETALRSVLTSLASVVALLERMAQEHSPDTDAAKDDRRQLGDQEARFPREAFDDIAGLFGRRLASAGAVRARLEAFLEGVDRLAAERPGAPSAASLLAEAAAVRDDTARLLASVSRARRRTTVLMALLYLVPLAFAGAVAIWYRAARGFEAGHWEITDPAGLYEPKGAGFALRDPYVVQVLRDFSRHYFGRPSHPRDLSPATTIVLKRTLRNQSHATYVSAVAVRGRLVETLPFPWERLDVTPRLEARADDENVEISDVGVGPAIDVRCQMKTESGTLSWSSEDRCLLTNAWFGPTAANQTPAGRRLVFVENGYLRRPLSLFRLAPEGGSDEQRPAYVRRVDELREFADVWGPEPVVAMCTYDSLRGEHHEMKVSLEGALTYQLQAGVAETDERAAAAAGAEGMEAVAALALAAANVVPPEPKGVDSLLKTLSLDMADLAAGEEANAATEADVILNPGGFLVLSTKVANLKGGTYELEVFVNGQPEGLVVLDALVPEDDRFDERALETKELPRFRGGKGRLPASREDVME